MGELYLLTFPNGKRYIGITSKTATRRRIVHMHHARKGRRGALQAAIRKHGAFEMRTLLIASDWEYLCEMERRAIVAFETRSPAGYNMTDGGEGIVGVERTEEQRRRMSEARKGRFSGIRFGFGSRHSEESKAKIAEAGRGRVFSEDRRRKMGASKVGNCYGLGTKRSEESKRRMSDWQKGVPKSEEHRAALSAAHKGKPWSAARRAAYEAKRGYAVT